METVYLWSSPCRKSGVVQKNNQGKLICCIVLFKAAFKSSRPQWYKERPPGLFVRARVHLGSGYHTGNCSFMCSCPSLQYSIFDKRNPLFFPLSMIVFHFINKRFLSNEIRLLYSGCLDAGRSRRIKNSSQHVISKTKTSCQEVDKN